MIGKYALLIWGQHVFISVCQHCCSGQRAEVIRRWGISRHTSGYMEHYMQRDKDIAFEAFGPTFGVRSISRSIYMDLSFCVGIPDFII